jgi:hypothetical protein
MKRLMIPAFAIIVVAAAAAIMPRSTSTSIDISAGAATAMPPLEELYAAVGVNELPVQEIEDQSLVYPAHTKP